MTRRTLLPVIACLAVSASALCLGQEIVLRDTIGLNSASTNGNGWLFSIEQWRAREGINNGYVVVVEVTAPPSTAVELASLRVIVGAAFGLEPWAPVDWYIAVWSSLQAMDDAIHEQTRLIYGDIASISRSTPDYGPVAFGSDADNEPTFELRFDLTPDHVIIPDATTYYVGFIAYLESYQQGIYGVMATNRTGVPDRVFCVLCGDPWPPLQWIYTNHPIYPPQYYHNGIMAIDISGMAVSPSCPGNRGDANCDGTRDFFDIDPFLTAVFDPAGYAAAFCGGATCAADADCSDVVDFFDIDPFLTCLFNGCAPCP